MVVCDPNTLLGDVSAVRGSALGVDLVPPASIELELVSAVMQSPIDITISKVISRPEAGAQEADGRDGSTSIGRFRVGGRCSNGAGSEKEERLELHGCWQISVSRAVKG